MKTFDEKYLITWSNRDKAVIGNEYYFADDLRGIQDNINKGINKKLVEINPYYVGCPFQNDEWDDYACILPVDAVIEIEPEKKYRACKTVKEFYELVMNELPPLGLKTDDDLIYNLLSRDIHFRSKNTGTEYYSVIRSISKFEDVGIKIILTHKSYLSFIDIFNNYEIEIDGKWRPFGVEDEN